ncbi:MAG: dipeptide epimerase [Bacteroidia bacterium]|jgi:L-alanine-DL-glutamate epimerase-like enolase superfamily enzyme
MNLSYKPYTLFFKRPFKIAHGVRESTAIVLTEIGFEGVVGYGEACLPPYLSETQESVASFLNKASKVLAIHHYPFDMQQVLDEIDNIDLGNTAAKAAIDIALHDLIGKLQNKPCWKSFDCNKNDTPYTTYTLGIDEPEIIRQKVIEGGVFKVLKVKLNGESDKQIIDTIRSVTDKPIAVDVNQGWKDKFVALDMIEWLKDKNVLFVEQPLPKANLDDALWLYERSPLPLIADESVQRYSDIDRIKNCFHGINIKLMKCTGLHEAHKMIRKARELNLKVLIGCMSETYCAVSAAAQLSPLVDYADLDGPLLIKNDIFKGITFTDGKITLSELPGIGVVKKED